jgi:hypothetical protein
MWFEPFGFSKGMQDPRTGETPDIRANGLALVGSVDSVTRQLEGLLKRPAVKWLFAWMYNGLVPHDHLMKSIELFATKVLPRVANGRWAASTRSRSGLHGHPSRASVLPGARKPVPSLSREIPDSSLAPA